MSYFVYQGKNIYYTSEGGGMPMLFLHGNTASSMMFEMLMPLYTDELEVIRMDFLGNGRSDRVERFPENIWLDQGKQVVALAETLGYNKINLIGTSGGAYAAINAALLRPELFRCVIADSFDGQRLARDFPLRFALSVRLPKRMTWREAFTNGIRVQIGSGLLTRIQRRSWRLQRVARRFLSVRSRQFRCRFSSL